jgi:hypothetical protein
MFHYENSMVGGHLEILIIPLFQKRYEIRMLFQLPDSHVPESEAVDIGILFN